MTGHENIFSCHPASEKMRLPPPWRCQFHTSIILETGTCATTITGTLLVWLTMSRHKQHLRLQNLPGQVKLPAKQKYCVSTYWWYHLFDGHCYRSADSKTVDQKQLERPVVKRKCSHKNSALTRCKAIRPTQAHGLIGLAPSVPTSPAGENAYIQGTP